MYTQKNAVESESWVKILNFQPHIWVCPFLTQIWVETIQHFFFEWFNGGIFVGSDKTCWVVLTQFWVKYGQTQTLGQKCN